MPVTWKEKSEEAKGLLAEIKQSQAEASAAGDKPTGEKAEELTKKISKANELFAEAREAKSADDLRRAEELMAQFEKDGGQPDGVKAALTPANKEVKTLDMGEQRKELLASMQGIRWKERAVDAFGLVGGTKAINEGSGGAGNFLVPPQYMQDLFAGTRRQGNALRRENLLNERAVDSNQILLPRGTGAATVGIVAENATKPSADQQFTQVTVNVFTLAGIGKLSKQIAEDANPTGSEVLMEELGTLLGNLEEQKIYNGSGSGEYRGILNTTGVSTVPSATQTALNGTVTGQILIDAIYDAVVAVQTSYFSTPSAIVMHPKRLGFLMKSKDSQNNYLFNPQGTFRAPGGLGGFPTIESVSTGYTQAPPSLAGIPIFTSANIPQNLGGSTNQDAVIVGDWKMAYWFQRQATTLDVSDTAGTAFETNQVWYRLEERAAFTAERYPAAFCPITGTGVV